MAEAEGGSGVDYIQAPQGHEMEYTGTLTKSSWLAQNKPATRNDTPPSLLNVLLAFISFFFCPFTGIMAIIFSIWARRAYGHGHYYEAEGLTYRARGTAIYSIAIGVALGIGMGLLLGLGKRYGWY